MQTSEKLSHAKESVNGYYRHMIGYGAVQLFCGIAGLALGIANAIVCGQLGSIGYGIWASLIFFSTGTINIVTYFRKNRCMVGTNMIMSIITACTAAVQLGLSVGAAAADYALLQLSKKNGATLSNSVAKNHNGLDFFFQFGCSDTQRSDYATWTGPGPTVTDALLATFAIVSLIIAILSSVYSCRICICPPGVSLTIDENPHGPTTSTQMTIVTKA